jgi:hypothetical protein
LPGKREGTVMSLKFLVYDEPHPFGEIFGKRNLAWPVDAYRVTLPKPDNSDGLNVFERVILKIIDACGIREADELAREICIPDELVKFVLLRLKDKGFIDENNEILNHGRDMLMKNEEKEPVYITAFLFRELATDKILPFLHLSDNENQLKKEERKEEGDKKKFKEIRCHKSYKKKKPEPRDVIHALRAMKKRSNISGNYSRFPAVNQIIIADEPEQYYLDCSIAIQKSDGEFRIADPFGNGFSLILESSFSYLLGQNENENLDKWLMAWKDSLSNPKTSEESDPKTSKKEPFDNDKNWGCYRNLVYNLRLRKDTQYRSIEQIHSALEWALFYSCKQRQYDAAIRELKFTNHAEHSNLLKKAAEKTGLASPQNGFHPVPEGKPDDFLNGKAEMATVISITLLMAENDPSHPLHKIVYNYPDFIIRLFDIKKKRDDQGHGKGKAQKNKTEFSEEDKFMREIVTALLPDIRFADTSAATVDRDLAADMMLDSRTNIQNEFGFKNFNRLGTNLQDRLIDAEQSCLSWKDVDDTKKFDANTFVFDLYATLEAMFRKILTGTLPPDIKNSEFIECARKEAMDAELGELPESLLTVKLRMIRQTLQGDDQSLGACVIVFLIVCKDSLQKVSEIQPSFLSDVDEIIKLRGHGNEPLFLAKNEIKELRKSVYKTIKTLLEVEKWDYF